MNRLIDINIIELDGIQRVSKDEKTEYDQLIALGNGRRSFSIFLCHYPV